MIKKVLLTLIIITATYYSYAQNFDELTEVSLTDESLKSFIGEFADSQNNDRGVYILNIFQKGDDHGIYELQFATWWYPYENDIASMAYTEVGGHLVLIYSGMERLFPSQARYQMMLNLIRKRVDKVFRQGDVPPTGTLPSVSAVICGGEKVYVAQHGLILPDEYSCIIEEPAEKMKNR